MLGVPPHATPKSRWLHCEGFGAKARKMHPLCTIYMYTYIHNIYIHTYKYMKYMYIHIHIHIYIYTHTYIHVYVYMWKPRRRIASFFSGILVLQQKIETLCLGKALPGSAVGKPSQWPRRLSCSNRAPQLFPQISGPARGCPPDFWKFPCENIGFSNSLPLSPSQCLAGYCVCA